jgi:DNA-binding GntR family transcriptional regulator
VDDFDIGDVARATQAGRRLSARAPLVDDVHGALVDMLMNHDVDPGARLNIDAIARGLGVSPTPIREALARMEAEGLVVKEPRRSYTVAPLIGVEDLRALIDFRLLVEPAAAAAAARNATAEQDMVYDATFHDMVAQLSGNVWLRDSLVRLRSHLHMYRLYHHARQAAATKPEHVAIATAVVAGEADAAAEAMRAHLCTAMRRIDDVFASAEASG